MDPLDSDALPADLLEPHSIAEFAERLDTYAAGLTPRERQLLISIIARAMDPLTRAAVCGPQDLLEPDERSVLETLAVADPE
jgi:hypothetical protein